MDWLANFQALEQWQQALAIVVAAVTVAAIVTVTKLGILQGKAGVAAPGTTSTTGATVAAMIVDSTALNRFTDTLAKTNELGDRFLERMDASAKAVGLIGERIDKLGERTDTLSDEVRRHAKEVRELTESKKG